MPVGAACCSTLKKAKLVGVGETVWLASKDKPPAPAAVTQVGASVAVGVHNPLAKRGGFPVVDGVVTAFDSVGVVKFASLTVPLAEALCEAIGACGHFRSLWALGGTRGGRLGERPFVGGDVGNGLDGLAMLTAILTSGTVVGAVAMRRAVTTGSGG